MASRQRSYWSRTRGGGTVSFTYGGHHVADVPVTLVAESDDSATTSALIGFAT
jgi:hypothetical protein